MVEPRQGGLELLDDEIARGMLASTEVAHLAYSWTDGTPRCTPIWFHWNGSEVVMTSPSNAPKSRAVSDGTPVAVTIDSASWPYAVLMLRGRAAVDDFAGVAPEYREAAIRYFGEAQGNAWCDQLPSDMQTFRIRVTPEWVGLLDFDGMRRLPSALAD